MIIKVYNTECKIMNQLHIDQLAALSNLCSFKVENGEFKASSMKNRNSKINWDGYRRLFNTQTQTFPTGLLYRIRQFLDMCMIEYKIDDHRTVSTSKFNLECRPDSERQYQIRAVIDSLINKNGIVKAATGSGKTTISAMTISKLGRNTVFIVHTKDLLYQAIESFKYLLNTDIGQIGDGIYNPSNITVATIQSLALITQIDLFERDKFDEEYDNDEKKIESTKELKLKCREWMNSVDVIMFDEVQRIASRTAYDTRMLFRNAEYSFGYSASPWRNDGADLMIEAAFGPIITDISASYLIELGYLMQPIIIVKSLKNNVWSGIKYSEIYKSAIVENMFRNIQIVQDAMEYYSKGLNTLILVTQIQHGKTLESMIKSNGIDVHFISGKSKSKYRREVIGDMRKGNAKLVIATTIADVGLDVPILEVLIEAGAGKSSVTALQRLGRIMRIYPGKKDCIFITYRDTAPFIYKHIDEKIKIWNTEPKFIIMEE